MDRSQLSDHDLLIRLDEKFDNFLEVHAADKVAQQQKIDNVVTRLTTIETTQAKYVGAAGVIGVLVGGVINWAAHYFGTKH